MKYAAGTTVPVEKSRMDLERTLVRYGASAFTSAWDARKASIGFAFKGWHVRFDIELPDPKSGVFTKDPRLTWRSRPAAAAAKAYEKELRRIWRALLMVIKMKLEAVSSGITTFEDEFLAHLVLPGQEQTVAEIALPRLMAAKVAPPHGAVRPPLDPLPSLPPAPGGG